MTIAKAIDYINDKLAGSDQPASANIETALYRLSENVGKGGGTLEPATADTLGGVKIGDGISVTEDGTISAAGGSSGYDCVIKLDAALLADIQTGVLESGTYAALKSKTESGDVITAKVYGISYTEQEEINMVASYVPIQFSIDLNDENQPVYIKITDGGDFMLVIVTANGVTTELI